MGMNAYFAYTIVGFKGTQNAVKKVMMAVTVEGVIFIIMSALDLRRYVFKGLPHMDDEGHHGRDRLVLGPHRAASWKRHRHRQRPPSSACGPCDPHWRALRAHLDRNRFLLCHEPLDPLAGQRSCHDQHPS